MGGHDRTRAVGGRLHAPKVRTGHRIDIERRASSALARRGHRAQSGHRRIGSVVFYLLLRTRQGLDFSGNCGYWTPRTSRRRARLWHFYDRHALHAHAHVHVMCMHGMMTTTSNLSLPCRFDHLPLDPARHAGLSHRNEIYLQPRQRHRRRECSLHCLHAHGGPLEVQLR